MTERRVLHICMCLSRGDAQLACAVRVDRLGVDQEAGIRRSTDGTEDGEWGMRLGVEGASCSRRPEEGSSGRWLLFSVVPCVFFWSLAVFPGILNGWDGMDD